VSQIEYLRGSKIDLKYLLEKDNRSCHAEREGIDQELWLEISSSSIALHKIKKSVVTIFETKKSVFRGFS